MAVRNYSYELDGLEFGRGTPYPVAKVESDADVTTNDAQQAREDGIRFGRDYEGGQLLTWTMAVSTRGPDSLDELARIKSVWRARGTRQTPGATLPLRYMHGGRARRVYGRPRRLTPNIDQYHQGVIPVVADFQCVDSLFYSDEELSSSLSIVPPPVGGLRGPLIGPLFATTDGEGQGRIVVGGTEPSWLTFRINGPISLPVVTVEGQWSFRLNITLQYDEWAVVDPTPWVRLARTSRGANLSGAFDQASRRLSAMNVTPGNYTITLRGIDATGTASLNVFYRNAYSSF